MNCHTEVPALQALDTSACSTAEYLRRVVKQAIFRWDQAFGRCEGVVGELRRPGGLDRLRALNERALKEWEQKAKQIPRFKKERYTEDQILRVRAREQRKPRNPLESVVQEQNQDQYALLAVTLGEQGGTFSPNCKQTLGMLQEAKIPKTLDEPKREIRSQVGLQTLALLERYMGGGKGDRAGAIQNEYLALLDKDYEATKLTQSEINEKRRRAAIKIQRAVRRYLRFKKCLAAVRIQRAWRRAKKWRSQQTHKLQAVRRKYLRRILQKALRTYIHKKRAKQFKSKTSRWQPSDKLILKIQALWIGFCARKLTKKRKSLAQWGADLRVNTLCLAVPMAPAGDSVEFMKQITLSVQIRRMRRYCADQDQLFDKKWKVYEDRLEKHCLGPRASGLRDWVMQKSEEGMVTWLNLKTLKSQKEHPALSLFNANRRNLLLKAQEAYKLKMQGHLQTIARLSAAIRNCEAKRISRARAERLRILKALD